MTAAAALRHAFELLAELEQACSERGMLLLLDFDGTLAPIVPRPEDAQLPAATRDVLIALSERVPVAIVSGRGLDDVRAMVGLDRLIYAGSHGLMVRGPDFEHIEPEALTAAGSLARLDEELRQAIADTEGLALEPKPHAYAVHYRHTPAALLGDLFARVDKIVATHPELRMHHGRKVIDVVPVGGHKGLAVRMLRGRFPNAFPIYLGDDTTDEDALSAVADDGLGVLVAMAPRDTHAKGWLRDPDEVRHFLETVASLSVGESALRRG